MNSMYAATIMPKTVLITGASGGIGKELAILYAKDHCDLILVSRNKPSLNKLKKELESRFKIKAFVFPSDLSIPASARSLFNKVKSAKFKVDILVNNAGAGTFGETVESDLQTTESIIELNITSLTELSILFGKEMKKRKSGAILNISSIAAFQPMPYFNVYSSSKSYVLFFTETLAKELEDYNVTVTCVCPGGTKTDFFKSAGHPEYCLDTYMSARKAAEIAKRSFEDKRLTVVCGLKNKSYTWISRFLPRSAVARLSKWRESD